MRDRLVRLLLPALLLIAASIPLRAQTPVPLAGTHFTFGIPEGPDAAVPATLDSSDLYLTVLSRFSGCGLIVSPNGYAQVFSFSADKPQQVQLDYQLMQSKELGTSNKGLLLTTSQPVNAYFHDWTPSGGDATQIFPDEALDTSYVVGGWSLYNDPGEQNHANVLVAAASDSTDVDVIPSVDCIGGIAAQSLIHVRLNRGETYILKTGIDAQHPSPSLAGTVVRSSKPVGVFSAVTCAYVPTGRESCNEMLDQVLGKKWWSKHYFAQGLGNGDSLVRLLITSDQDFFATMNGAFASSTNGRIETSFDNPVEITTTKPVLVQQITGGSDLSGSGVGDPTLVTLLPPEHYADTLFWSTPRLGMANFAPIVLPTANIAQTMFDGQPLSTLGTPTPINGSNYSALRLNVFPGPHLITSPGGVFTMGVGFDIYDAYSFVAGSVGEYIPRDTIKRSILLSVDSAATCDTFSVAFRLDSALTIASGTTDLDPSIRYDPNLMTLVSFTPDAMLTNASYTVDTSVVGLIRVHVTGSPLLVGKDLFHVVFYGTASGSAGFSNVLDASACGENDELFIGGYTPFAIRPELWTMPRTFAIPDSDVSDMVTCQPYWLSLVADTSLTARDRFVPIRIEFLYGSGDQDVVSTEVSNLLKDRMKGESNVPGDYTLELTQSAAVDGGDTLLRLLVEPKTVGMIATKTRVTYVLCGDTLTKEFDLSYPVAKKIDSVHATLGILTAPVTWGNESSADITLNGLPIDAHVKDFTLDVTYNHNVLTFYRWVTDGTLTSNWSVSGPTTVQGETERFHFTSSAAELGTSGPLVHLLFRTYVSDSASTPIGISSSLESSASCPLTFQAPATETLYAGRDLCGDSVLRSLLRGEKLVVTGVERAGMHNTLGVRVAQRGVLHIEVFDLLGRTIGERTLEVQAGESRLELPEPNSSGEYIVRVNGFGVVRSTAFVVIR